MLFTGIDEQGQHRTLGVEEEGQWMGNSRREKNLGIPEKESGKTVFCIEKETNSGIT